MFWFINLLNISLTHYDHAIGNFHRLFLIVRHEHAGKFQLFMQLSQPATQLFTHLCIQRAKGLIKQQNLRLNRQRTRQGHTLFLSTGKLRRETVGQMGQLHHLQQFGDFRFDGRRIRTLATRKHAQAKSDIVEHRHMAEQRIVLEHKTHFTIAGV
ncbi:hypothetical protein D3C87_1710730 [compost metagenome]